MPIEAVKAPVSKEYLCLQISRLWPLYYGFNLSLQKGFRLAKTSPVKCSRVSLIAGREV